jgi:CDP-glucose 4,6-dehydratase
MSVLVTGASGFVGAWLTRKLADEGQTVVAQMRRAPSKLFCDLGLDAHSNVTVINDPAMQDVLIRMAPQELYHLGGMSQIGEALVSPVVALEANARASWLLFEALRGLERPPRTIVASTDSIYGETGGRAATEDDLPRATGPYEVSKLAADYAAR